MLRMSSNNSVNIFLNGAHTWSNKVERVAATDDNLVPVTLPPGTSTILIKTGQTGLHWCFYSRITERNSLAIPKTLRISVMPPK